MRCLDVGDLEPLAPVARQRLAGWIAMLDVDLPAAQAALAHPTDQLPLPPCALPELRDRHGVVLAPAVEAADPATEPVDVPASAVAAPPAPAVLRGAYARRRAAASGTS